MKLFLASLAINDQQAIEHAKLVGKDQKDIKLALIENAADDIVAVPEIIMVDGFMTMPLGDAQALVINGNEQRVVS